jgi:hypothetical protein
MKGYSVCWVHGGALSEFSKGRWVAKLSQELRKNRYEEFKSRQGKAPPELLLMRIYKEADTRDKVKLIESWGKSSWVTTLKLVRQSR